MGNKRIKFDYDNGKAICTIFEKGKKYKGIAKVHNDDKDFESEKTGLTIAEYKAEIKRYDDKAKRALEKAKLLEKQMQHYLTLAAQYKERKKLYEQELEKFIENKEIFKKRYKAVKLREEMGV